MRCRVLTALSATILQLLPPASSTTWLLQAFSAADGPASARAFAVSTARNAGVGHRSSVRRLFVPSSASAASAFGSSRRSRTFVGTSGTVSRRFAALALSLSDATASSSSSSSTAMASVQGSTDKSTEPKPMTNATSLPNWRVIPSNAQNWDEHLMERPEWSDEQFRESLALYNRFMECTDSYVSPAIKDALNCLDHAYRLYGPRSVVGSFNGGKDAVVILHLMRAAHAKHYNSTLDQNGQRTVPVVRPRVIYFDHPDEFPQVKDFLHECVDSLDLDMLAFEQGTKFSQGLDILVRNNILDGCGRASWPMSFVLGTRADDPNAGGQDQFAPSSHYMPPFMRVNPVLQWTYGHVWHFLRLFQLPYCVLYDQGYTSLGTTKDTLPCPALRVPTGTIGTSDNSTNATVANALPKYWPAYMLGDWSQERAGRVKKPVAAKTTTTASSTAGTAKTSSVTTDNATAPTGLSGKPSKPPAKKKDANAARVGAPERAESTASDFRQSDPKVMLETQIERPEYPTTGEGNSGIIGGPGNVTENMETVAPPNLPERGANADSALNATGVSSLHDDSTAFTLDSDADSVHQKSVGILIIGDEILKGLTMDQNTHVAAKALRAQNVLLSRVVVVSDTPEEIVEEIQRLQEEVDVIITSGGVGPTHDDVTIKSVASALGRDMVFHKEMADLLSEKMNFGTPRSTDDCSIDDTASRSATDGPRKEDLSEAHVKMATLPSNAKLRYLSDVEDDWPVLQCRNIFILPGVPEFFAKKIENVARYLSSQLERSIGYKVVLGIDESSIVDVLNQVVEQHPNVSFGSYPFVSHPEFQTVLTLEGNLVDDTPTMTPVFSPGMAARTNSTVFQRSSIMSSKDQRDRYVQLALEDLIQKLPEGSILRVDNDDLTPFT